MCRLRFQSHSGGAALMLGALMFGALMFGSCSRSEKTSARPDPPQAPTVSVAAATLHDLVRQEALAAEFHPFQVIDVHAKVAGYLKKIFVDVGDHVKEGQTLAILEVPELAQDITRAKAGRSRSNSEVQREREELARAEAAHQSVHLIFDRLQSVAKTRPNLIAQQEIDDARARDQTAEANISAARAALAAAQQGVEVSQADLEKTETMDSYTKITAPFAGIITKRYADTGAMVPAGTATTSNGLALVQLSQNSLLRLILPVPETDVTRIKLGQVVDVRVGVLNRTFQGRVTRFADTLNMSTRTMDTQIDVPNPNLILIPGMYAEAILTLDKRQGVLSIPLEGLNVQGDSTTVYVVGKDHKIEIRPVKIGLETATQVEILSGLEPNDLVVTGNRSQLTPGQIVQPKLMPQPTKETRES